tara:strand:+ start:10197 stop:10439 length:243 start_codon:yes stop_codon:yes gene_type:complete
MSKILQFTFDRLKNLYQTTNVVYGQLQDTFGNEDGFIDDDLLEFLNRHPKKKVEIIKALEDSNSSELRIDIKGDNLVFLD